MPRRPLRAAALLALLLALAGCGRMGDPIPPRQALLEPPSRPSLRGRDGAIVLSWTAPAKTMAGALPEPIRGYAVERQVLAPGESECRKCPTGPDHVRETDTTNIVYRDLSPGFTYRFRVRAIDYREREGKGSPWVEATWTAPPPIPEVTAQGISRGVRVHVGESSPSGFKPLGLAVYTSDGKLLQRIPAGVSDAEITGFPNDRPVQLVARWEEEDPKGGWVMESLPRTLTVVPRDLTPPPPPGAIAGFPDPGGATLHWLGAPGETVESYLIERSEEEGVWIEAGRVPGSQLLFRDTGLLPGAVYTYRVSAMDRAGNLGNPSATVRIKAGQP